MRLHIEDTFNKTLTIIVSETSSKGEFLQGLWERSKEVAINELEENWEHYYSNYEKAIEAQTQGQYEAFLDTMIIKEYGDENYLEYEIETERIVYAEKTINKIDEERHEEYRGYFIQQLDLPFDDEMIIDYDVYYFDDENLYCFR